MFLHIAAIVLCCPVIPVLYFALPTCKLTEIEASNIVYCMVMTKFTTKKNMGVPNFMEESPFSYEIGDPGSPFWGVPIFT